MASNQRVTTENINEVILTLLNLKSGMKINYQTYFDIIRKKLSKHSLVGKELPKEEHNLLNSELIRIRKIKDRDKKQFIIRGKSTKVSTGASAFSGGENRPSGGGKIVKSKSGKISADKFFYQHYIQPVNVKDITEKTTKISRNNDNTILEKINLKLDSIIESLNNIYDYETTESEKRRKEGERGKRKTREQELEFKAFDGIKKAISTITKPFQSIWDTIVNFLTNVILGRIIIKLLDWIADSNNQDKIKSLIRFFSDHWPKLLVLYLRFGTGIGRFIGKLTGILIKGSIALIKKTASLAASLGLKKAGKLASFLGGPKGKLLGAGLTLGANVAGMVATSNFIENFAGGENKSNSEDIKNTPVPGYFGGGWIGGLKNFFGNMFQGLVKGPKGVDKVAAMLTDGEFVMSAGAVKKWGLDTLESMNAAGGGTNVPQIAEGVTYAAGGGFIGETPKEIKLRNNYEYRFGKDFTSKLTNDELRQISNYYNSLSNSEVSRIDSRRIMGYGDELKSMGEEMISRRNNVPHSYTQSTRIASGLTDVEGELRSNEKISRVLRYDTPELGKSKPKVTRIDPSRMLPAAGQSSANAMRAAEKAARLVRQPIPASRAIVPYTGGGLVRSGVTGGLSVPPIQQAYTNMNVPGGSKRSTLMRFLNNPATKLVGRSARVLDAPIIGDMILPEGTSEYDQRSNVYNDPRLSPIQRRIMMESVGLRGGAMKGGYKLREQSFKDAPKTQIMTDDKGKPFVGYKALRNGKLVYVRGPQPGTGTSNPLESLGRMINPGAYKDVDDRNQRKQYEEASKNSISSLRSRGASQATISKTQKKLNKSVPPLPRVRPKPQVAGGGMGGRRGSGANPSRGGSKPPSFSPNHSRKATRLARSTIGVNSKI